MYKLVDGQTLSKYCTLNKIPYVCIWERITFKKMTPDQALNDFYEKRKKPHYCKFWYKGTTLRKYCALHNLDYQRIIDYKRCHNVSLEEVMKKF